MLFRPVRAPRLVLTAALLIAWTRLVHPASAAPLTFDVTGCTPIAVNASVVGSCQAGLLGINPENGVNGLHMTGDVTATALSNGDFSITLHWSGTATGSYLGSLWHEGEWFLSGTPGFMTVMEWTFLQNGQLHMRALSPTFPLPDNPTRWLEAGTHVFAEPLTTWDFTLKITSFNAAAGNFLHLTVPDSSFDINPTAVPEPSTALLVLCSATLVIVKRRAKLRR